MSLINFRSNDLLEVPEWLVKATDLKLILWAGDGCHDGTSDIERLPGYDLYLCEGYPENLDINVDYIKRRGRNGCICTLDVFNEAHMATFINFFAGKIALINSDYNGNTPTLPLAHYKSLLKQGGMAYNIIGINGCRFPEEELYDTLEVFAPVLPESLKPKRRWTKEFLELAKANDLSPDATWSSPDINVAYYAPLIGRQKAFLERQQARNPNFSSIYKYSSDNFEEYLNTLPTKTLMARINYASQWDKGLLEIDDTYVNRFHEYLKKRVMADGRLTFDDWIAECKEDPQTLLKCLEEATEVTTAGLKATVGPYIDLRRMERCYGLVVSKE
jgi:hypothetical protein